MKSELRILLWNTYRQPLFDEVKTLVKDHNINLLFIIENTGDGDMHLKSLRKIDKGYKKINHRIFNKAQIFTSVPDVDIKEIHGHGRYGIYHLTSRNFNDVLICVVHFPSKVNWGDSDDHFGLCVEMKRDIELKEIELGHHRTFILGDFNMNPFEKGFLSATGLNNTSSREIALTNSRNVFTSTFKFFYNPMWNFFGEFSKGNVQGTHYFNTYKYINFYWNIYDQVMFRPDLLDGFNESSLEIIDQIDTKSLTKTIKNTTRINKEVSDHLPLKFNLSLTNK